MRSPLAVLLLISCFFVNVARSQSHELLVQGQTGKLYLEHTVVAKDNWYSVGRLYNVNPKELTTYNQLALTKPLTIGQALQIPLTAVNFSQTGQKAPAETLVPVYHIIQEKEWMYRISVNHNKVPIPNLEKWNNVSKDQIHAGMHLVVGYLKVKTALSALATASPAPAVATTGGEKPVNDKTTADSVRAKTKATELAPPAKTKVTDSTPAAKTRIVETHTAISTPPAVAETGANPTAVTTEVSGKAGPSHNGGAFKGDYNESGKSATGQAGTFKSTSGWQDGKYYALMNGIPVGTVVRVNDAATGKSIYAKILGQLPDMKESVGLAIRISNSAAAELGEGEGRFTVEVKY
jgi:LysM repeat protein